MTPRRPRFHPVRNLGERLKRVDTLSVGLGISAAVLGLVAVLTHPNRRNILSFLLGVSAGLVGFQIFRIHAFTILVVLWACLPQENTNKNAPKHVAVLAIAALLLASTTFLGELVNSPTLGLQLLGLAGSAAIVALRASRRDAKAMLWGLLVISTIGSAVGLLQVFRIIPMDLWHLDVSTVGRPTGIYPEPDWLGMFSGIGVLLAWRLAMSRPLKVSFVVINLSVFVLAMARASWVALLVSICAAWIAAAIFKRENLPLSGSEGGRRGRVPAVVVASLATFIVLSAVPQLQEDLSVRVSTLLGTVQADDISGQARIRQNDSLFALAESVPVYGHGLSAAGRVGVWGQLNTEGASENNVASNWVLGMWVDGAWFAVPLVVYLMGLALARVQTIPGQLLLFTLVCSLFSNAFFFPVTWFLVGLAIVAVRPPGRSQLPEAPALPALTPDPHPVGGFTATSVLIRATTTGTGQVSSFLRGSGAAILRPLDRLKKRPRHRMEHRAIGGQTAGWPPPES